MKSFIDDREEQISIHHANRCSLKFKLNEFQSKVNESKALMNYGSHIYFHSYSFDEVISKMFELRICGDPVSKCSPNTNNLTGDHSWYTAMDVEAYEKSIRKRTEEKMRCSDIARMKSAVKMCICIFQQIPDYLPEDIRLNMADGTVRPCIRPDADEIARVVMDALNGTVYADDSQICSLTVNKWYVRSDPGLNIYVSEIS